MEWLNYHHLFYFWTVAKEGSIAKASEKLRLAQPTISGQLRTLEESLGEKLFVRAGRGLVLTEMGKTVLKYADEIFTLGRELQDTVRGRPTGRPHVLRVGIADVVPKQVAHRLLEPALRLTVPVKLHCTEDDADRLVAQLGQHELDLVLCDQPLSAGSPVKAFSHLLGESGITVFAAKGHDQARTGFPRSLDGAPMLLPTDGAALRQDLESWFESIRAWPDIRGEFDDSALAKVFGEAGMGMFVAPTVVEEDLLAEQKVVVVGRTDAVRVRYHALTLSRRTNHPAVAAISNSARKGLFA